MLIREMTLADVPATYAIRAALRPWIVASLATHVNGFRTAPPAARALQLVAEIDGTIAGFGHGGLNTATKEPHAGFGFINVHPDFQRQGVGSALWAPLSAHMRALGVRRAMGWGDDSPLTEQWMAKRGVRRGASARFSSVDPRQLPPTPAIPPGVTLATAREVGPAAIYELDKAAAADIPGDMSYDGTPKDEWIARVWNGPDLSHDASTIALVDGTPAALTYLDVNLELKRAWTGGTSTLPAYRGRGLAKLIKSVCLRKAAALGVTEALTSNDYTNAPMLAVNEWLGYQVVATSWSYVTDFGEV